MRPLAAGEGAHDDIPLSAPHIVYTAPFNAHRRFRKTRNVVFRDIVTALVNKTETGGGEPNRRRNVGVDGRKNFTVRKPDRISGLTAHGIAAEIYTVTVDAKLANSPFDRIENALFA